ncbi:unnamed protein product [Prorocentrum cordatum]|uniref:BUD13 homolog n=1 Tax=Prorocentrum cordatum TaxID=2364126 RepID=A0ABN9XAP8_9DINO|nr:unnamed protein product [Polarella glacialis]
MRPSVVLLRKRARIQQIVHTCPGTVNEEEQDAEVARIAAQPFARYTPDEKHLEALRERSDWNDPMRKFEEEQREAEGGAAGPGAGAAAARPPRPKCPHAPWPNRFNIPPGYRWDGKVRGSDFEKRWLQAKNGRELKKAEAYRWEQEMDQNS